MNPNLLTDIQVAELLGTKRRVVQSWRLTGNIAYMKSRPVLMLDSAVFDFIDECNNSAPISGLVIASRDDVKIDKRWSNRENKWICSSNGSTPIQRKFIPERETSLRKGVLLSISEAAEWLQCPEEWIIVLKKAGFLPCCPGLGSLIITGATLRMMQPYEGIECKVTDLISIYDNKSAAERLSITPKDVSLFRGLGRIGYIPVRPILYREADILNYLASQKNYERVKADKARIRQERITLKLERSVSRAEAIQRYTDKMQAQAVEIRSKCMSDPNYIPKFDELVHDFRFEPDKSGAWCARWINHLGRRCRSFYTKDVHKALDALGVWQETGAPWN